MRSREEFNNRMNRKTLPIVIVVVICLILGVFLRNQKDERELPHPHSQQETAVSEPHRNHSHDHESHNLLASLPFKPPSLKEAPSAPDERNHPTTFIEGTVTDPLGVPLVGAAVDPVLWFQDSDGQTTNMDNATRARTDEQGHFKIPVHQGTYTLRAFYTKGEPHLYGASEPFPVRWGETRQVHLEIGLYSTLRGSVCDAEGNGVEGVMVTITPSMSNGDPVYIRFTNQEGKFSVSGLRGPESSVIIHAPEYRAEPGTRIQQSPTEPFAFVLHKPRPVATSNILVFTYDGPLLENGEQVQLDLFLDDRILWDEWLIPLKVGEQRIQLPLGLEHNTSRLTVQLSHPELGILRAPVSWDKTRAAFLARGSLWEAGRTVNGQVAGRNAPVVSRETPMWVILVSQAEKPAGPRVAYACVQEDGTFVLNNIPQTPQLHVVLQSGMECIKLHEQGYTLPLPKDGFLKIQLDF